MRYGPIAAAAAMGFGLLAGASAAMAQEATASSCHQLESQVRTALDGNPQAAKHEAAVKQRDSGRQYCSHGFYKVGSDHLTAALKLLGSSNT